MKKILIVVTMLGMTSMAAIAQNKKKSNDNGQQKEAINTSRSNIKHCAALDKKADTVKPGAIINTTRSNIPRNK